MSEKTEEMKKAEALANIQETAEKSANEIAQKAMDAMTAKMNEQEESFKKASEEQKLEAKKELQELSKAHQAMQAEMKKTAQTKSQKEKTFNEHIEDVIKENAEIIQGFRKGDQEVKLSLKAVGDMSFTENFPDNIPFTQDVRTNMIQTPYNRVWLSDLLPNGTSTGSSVLYPREGISEGGVEVWDGTGNKAQVDFNFESQSAFFKWIAGWVVVDRDMLDDLSWLSSYLQAKLLVSLKTAENDFILNGTTDTNPVDGLLSVATAYDGVFTNPVDMIIDSAYGQIVENTMEFYQGNTAIVNPRDAVRIGLNKAGGSGEYDLPSGSVGYTNGNLTVGGLRTVPTVGIDQSDFLTLDRNAVMFLRRMSPEIRMFEDAELAKQNKIMFRIEERVTQAIFNTNAIVNGTFGAYVPAP